MTRRLRWLALASLSSALALPAIAHAQSQCPVVRALSSQKPSSLEGIGITINADGAMDVTRYGVPGVLRGAESCMLDIAADGFDLDCEWSYEKGQEDAAKRTIDGLRRGLDDCLPNGLENQTRETKRPSEEQLQAASAKYGASYARYLEMTEYVYEFESVFEREGGDEIEVQLSMRRKRDTGRISINATFYR